MVVSDDNERLTAESIVGTVVGMMLKLRSKKNCQEEVVEEIVHQLDLLRTIFKVNDERVERFMTKINDAIVQIDNAIDCQNVGTMRAYALLARASLSEAKERDGRKRRRS